MRHSKQSEEILKKHGIEWHETEEDSFYVDGFIDIGLEPIPKVVSVRERASILCEGYKIDSNYNKFGVYWSCWHLEEGQLAWNKDMVTAQLEAIKLIEQER